jgi:hypothetical protein
MLDRRFIRLLKSRLEFLFSPTGAFLSSSLIVLNNFFISYSYFISLSDYGCKGGRNNEAEVALV